MSKTRTTFRCSECGGSAPRWQGRCPACGAWNVLVEERIEPIKASAPVSCVEPARRITHIDTSDWGAHATGVSELDRVLGGGLVPGSVTVLGGEPGIGKSTLLTQVAAQVAASGRRVLYVSAEESAQQVRQRAERLGALVPELWLAAETSMPHLLSQLDDVQPAMVVIDSIQTVYDPELASAPGSVAQVRECAHRLVQEAKQRSIAVVLVGHVTKDGGLAGPRVLEHVVDTVLAFEGDRHHALRVLRASKHRFGSTAELGVFEMADEGLLPVRDPSSLFLADRTPGVAGSAVVPMMDGHRPLLVEVQALVTAATGPQPRRSAHGIDQGRLALLLAVLERHAKLALGRHDVFALAVGGIKVVEPGADLALALAVASSATDHPLAADLVACAEVGLGGELRQVAHTARRLAEAARLGFGRVILPFTAPDPPPGLHALRAANVVEALALARSKPVVATTARDGRASLALLSQ